MSSDAKSMSAYWLASEAALMLMTAKVAIHILPLRAFGRYRGSQRDGSRVSVDDVIVAVGRAARRLPGNFVCYPRALAAHWMLRRRGVRSFLHFGIHPPSGNFSAHVWTSVGDDIIEGAEGARGLTSLIAYPEAVGGSQQPFKGR